jgi:hypothetical protein
MPFLRVSVDFKYSFIKKVSEIKTGENVNQSYLKNKNTPVTQT